MVACLTLTCNQSPAVGSIVINTDDNNSETHVCNINLIWPFGKRFRHVDTHPGISTACYHQFFHDMHESWRRHQMETFSALLAIYAEKSPVPGEFHTQRPVTRSFDVYLDLRPNIRLNKQSWGWWFETPLCPLWRHRNDALRRYFSHFLYDKV